MEQPRSHASTPAAPAGGAPSWAVAPDGFLLRCPSCQYDLAGSPDGPCPECGTPFTRDGLISTEWRRRQFRSSGHGALYIAIGLALLPFFWAPAEPVAVLILSPMWLFAIVWMLQLRPQLLFDRPVLSLWLIVPLARTALGFMGTRAAIPVAALCATAIILIIIHSYRRAPLRTIRGLGLGAGLPALAFGLAFTAYGSWGVAHGYSWSEWDYPPSAHLYQLGDPRVPQAMLFPHILAFGLSALAFAAVALGLGLTAFMKLHRSGARS